MSCTLIFTAGAKGGSSKTMAARFPITYLQEEPPIDPGPRR